MMGVNLDKIQFYILKAQLLKEHCYSYNLEMYNICAHYYVQIMIVHKLNSVYHHAWLTVCAIR